MTEQQLIDLKEEITEAKDEINRLEGRKDWLMKQLKDEWGCKTLKQAKKKLQTIKEDILDYDEKIEAGVEKLKETYDFE